VADEAGIEGGRVFEADMSADTIETSCTGVTPTSCPIASESIDVDPHFLTGRSKPRVSLGLPSTMVKGGISMLIFEHPPVMDIFPMRQNW